MYLATNESGPPASTLRIAAQYGVSLHHLQKAVQGLRRLGYVSSLPGRRGGLRLAVPAASLKIGAVVAALESSGCLVDCRRGPCPLAGACLLKGALDRAERAFFAALDDVTLADVVRGPTARTLRRMIAQAA